MELMPTFNNEQEYNEYFKEETEYCSHYRNASGVLEFKTISEFHDFIDGLMNIKKEM